MFSVARWRQTAGLRASVETRNGTRRNLRLREVTGRRHRPRIPERLAWAARVSRRAASVKARSGPELAQVGCKGLVVSFRSVSGLYRMKRPEDLTEALDKLRKKLESRCFRREGARD